MPRRSWLIVGMVFLLLLLLDQASLVEPGSGRDEMPDDDVLLQAPQVIDGAGGGRLDEDAGRFLEARGRNERLGSKRRFGDSQQHRLRLGLVALLGGGVGAAELLARDDLA